MFHRFAIILFIIGNFGITLLSSAQSTTVVLIESKTLQVGESDTLAVTINCIVDWCSAYDISIIYDPSIVSVDSLEIGGYLGSISRAEVLVPIQLIDSAGAVRVSAAALGSVVTSTDSTLFELHITAVGAGSANFYVSNLMVSDASGNPITANARSGNVDILNPITPTETITFVSTLDPLARATSVARDITQQLAPPQACTLSTTQNANIYVGPSAERTVRGSLRPNTSYQVTGYALDDNNEIWWLIQPTGVTTELDRYWVNSQLVETAGACADVPLTEGSNFVPLDVAPPTPVPGAVVPVIVDAGLEGTCASYRYFVTWMDPDGDANRIVDASQNSFRIPISGSSGTWYSPYYSRISGYSYTLFQVVDSAGHRSQGHRVPLRCP